MRRQLQIVLPTTPPSCNTAAQAVVLYLKGLVDGFTWHETPSGQGGVRGWWRDEDGHHMEDRSILLLADLDDGTEPDDVHELLEDVVGKAVEEYGRSCDSEQVGMYIAVQWERRAVIVASPADLPRDLIPR